MNNRIFSFLFVLSLLTTTHIQASSTSVLAQSMIDSLVAKNVAKKTTLGIGSIAAYRSLEKQKEDVQAAPALHDAAVAGALTAISSPFDHILATITIADAPAERLISFIESLSNEQIAQFADELYKQNKTNDALQRMYVRDTDEIKKYNKAVEKIGAALLERGPSETLDHFAYYFSHQIPLEKNNQLLKTLAENKYDPFAEYQAKGPLFSKKEGHIHAHIARLTARTVVPNFDGLLPDILAYVAHEYELGRFVVFHGRSPSWMLLDRVYHALYNATHDKKASDDFVHLRFRDHSTITNQALEALQKNGDPSNFEHVLFVNLQLFKNDTPMDLSFSRNSWDFATQGMDESARKNKETDPNWISKKIKVIFEESGRGKEYEQLITEKPDLFTQLETLFEKAIKEQGNHGQLVILSMPNEVARKSIYYADQLARKVTPSFFDSFVAGEDPVIDAENIDHFDQFSEWCAILQEEFINPEAAEKAGVKIVGFDPTVYQRTSAYLKFDEKLKEIMKEIEQLHTKNEHAEVD